MFKKILIPLYCLSLATLSCRSDSNEEWSVVPGERVGMVNATYTFESLAEAYGAGQVRRKEIYIAEGESRPGFILFAGRDRELEVALDGNGTPQFLRISRDGSPWKTANGVRTGLSLEKLQEINGQPFLFFGAVVNGPPT